MATCFNHKTPDWISSDNQFFFWDGSHQIQCAFIEGSNLLAGIDLPRLNMHIRVALAKR